MASSIALKLQQLSTKLFNLSFVLMRFFSLDIGTLRNCRTRIIPTIIHQRPLLGHPYL